MHAACYCSKRSRVGHGAGSTRDALAHMYRRPLSLLRGVKKSKRRLRVDMQWALYIRNEWVVQLRICNGNWWCLRHEFPTESIASTLKHRSVGCWLHGLLQPKRREDDTHEYYRIRKFMSPGVVLSVRPVATLVDCGLASTIFLNYSVSNSTRQTG